MTYNYATERPKIFTEEGQVMFLQIRDRAKMLITAAGACRCLELMLATNGDSWQMLACVDRLVELGELREVTAPGSCAGQHRIFTEA